MYIKFANMLIYIKNYIIDNTKYISKESYESAELSTERLRQTCATTIADSTYLHQPTYCRQSTKYLQI